MVGTLTNNFGLSLQGAGDNSGTWGTTGSGGEPGLNSGVFAPLDAILGANLPVSISTVDVSLSLPQWTSAGIFVLTGTLTGTRNLILPLSPNSVGPTTAVGGKFIVVNNTTGAFNVIVRTAATGSVGVIVPQGFAVSLYSDTVNVAYADNGLPAFAAASAGNPNGLLAGTAGSLNTNASLAFDFISFILYVCTQTGTSSTAVWTNIVSLGLPQPALQGYLTPTSGVAIIPGDAVSQVVVYYTPYVGSWAAVHNGSKVIPYQFTQMSLALSPTQASSNIYDVFLAYNGGTPVIGTGPSWSAGGGSVTPGSCARGTGAGSTSLSRDAVSGLWVNTVSMTLTPSGAPITVPAGQGIYLGSLFIDTTAGQVSCLRSYGQNRKWGIWNAYNRVPINLLMGDPTASWTFSTGNTFRQANANVNNQIQVFIGLAEEETNIEYLTNVTENSNGNTQTAIGVNSTTSPSGFVGAYSGLASSIVTFTNRLMQPPLLGINNYNALENSGTGGSNATGRGTQFSMLMTASYRG